MTQTTTIKREKIPGMVLFTFVLFCFLIDMDRVQAQIIEMEIEIPAFCTLKFIPGQPEGAADSEICGEEDVSFSWLEIAGDENIGILVQINHQEEPVRACYINTGTFHLEDAVPFRNNKASFILNRKDQRMRSSPCFKAWIGIADDEVTQMTVDYL